MTFVSCSVPERFVNPLFEVFEGGDFILSSYRDIEEDFTRMRIFFEDAAAVDDARRCLQAALDIVGVEAVIESGEIADEDWRFAYRRHFKTELVSPRILVQPEWEDLAVIKFDPGMAFGTGKHETTKACLGYIDELSPVESMLDMGTGSGILAIAAAKLGCPEVAAFDVDQEAVDAAKENAAKNNVTIDVFHHALGRASTSTSSTFNLQPSTYSLVVANILGPLLIRFADEIIAPAKDKLVISGILDTIYPEVLAAFTSRGFREISHRTIGEWTTGLLERVKS